MDFGHIEKMNDRSVTKKVYQVQVSEMAGWGRPRLRP